MNNFAWWNDKSVRDSSHDVVVDRFPNFAFWNFAHDIVVDCLPDFSFRNASHNIVIDAFPVMRSDNSPFRNAAHDVIIHWSPRTGVNCDQIEKAARNFHILSFFLLFQIASKTASNSLFKLLEADGILEFRRIITQRTHNFLSNPNYAARFDRAFLMRLPNILQLF